MKKTLTVNLGGTVFNIDDDAYRLLDNYLSNLKMHFRKEAGADEIVDDIERRISELFAEKLSAGSQVITIADVEEVIARMGKPEDMETFPPSSALPTASTSPFCWCITCESCKTATIPLTMSAALPASSALRTPTLFCAVSAAETPLRCWSAGGMWNIRN